MTAPAENPGLKKLASTLLSNLKAGEADPEKWWAAKMAEEAKIKPCSRIPFGKGTHAHHQDQAMAHLEAADAHAQAARSAQVVEAAGEHEDNVAAADAADEKVR
ncbi:MAG: hypothetical protein ACRD3I_05205 [Terriglobales bacterium]